MNRPLGQGKTDFFYSFEGTREFIEELKQLDGVIINFSCKIDYKLPMTDKEFTAHNKALQAQAEKTQAGELKLLKKLLEKYPDAART